MITPRDFICFVEGMNFQFHNRDDFTRCYGAVRKIYTKEADEKYVKGKGYPIEKVVRDLKDLKELKAFFNDQKYLDQLDEERKEYKRIMEEWKNEKDV